MVAENCRVWYFKKSQSDLVRDVAVAGPSLLQPRPRRRPVREERAEDLGVGFLRGVHEQRWRSSLWRSPGVLGCLEEDLAI